MKKKTKREKKYNLIFEIFDRITGEVLHQFAISVKIPPTQVPGTLSYIGCDMMEEVIGKRWRSGDHPAPRRPNPDSKEAAAERVKIKRRLRKEFGWTG